METEWDWKRIKKEFIKEKIFKKEGENYEIWRIWWCICTTRIKK